VSRAVVGLVCVTAKRADWTRCVGSLMKCLADGGSYQLACCCGDGSHSLWSFGSSYTTSLRTSLPMSWVVASYLKLRRSYWPSKLAIG
jgi:hypothetical protein